MKKNKVVVMGAGNWGTTFAKVVADATKNDVVLWARRESHARAIAETHVNQQYLPGVTLPKEVIAISDATQALAGATHVVMAVPSQALRSQLAEWKEFIPRDAVIISLIKGMERHTDARMSEVIYEELGTPRSQLVVVSGPNIAKEVAANQPTASVVACESAEVAKNVASLCTTSYFHVFTSDDVVGVELGGIVKNVIALAVGVCEGMGYGDNMKSAVITRGLSEMRSFIVAQGGREDTVTGLAGLGDLVVTCSSPSSRNHTAGRLLGEGNTLNETISAMTQVAEGVKSTTPVVETALKQEISMPIALTVQAILEGAISRSRIAASFLSDSTNF